MDRLSRLLGRRRCEDDAGIVERRQRTERTGQATLRAALRGPRSSLRTPWRCASIAAARGA
ncbi:MAG: hypothetical protein O7F14_09260 [Alphaproteobacteria bacterium]|nr:hypothetical protein [Alphaproteobacteria bacterium]